MMTHSFGDWFLCLPEALEGNGTMHAAENIIKSALRGPQGDGFPFYSVFLGEIK